jgi:hypothetical protein
MTGYTALSRALIASLLLFLVACDTTPVKPPPPEPPTPSAPPCVCEQTSTALAVIGEAEHVLIGSEQMQHKARIDTGATTTSVGINSIQHFERDGAKWVKFEVKDRLNGDIVEFERPLLRSVEIKSHGTESQIRPVVRMRIMIGPISDNIDVTLNNRDSFTFPVLIGRNFLDDRFLVDVSKKYVAGDIETP